MTANADDQTQRGHDLVRRMFQREPVSFPPSAPSGFHFLDRVVHEMIFGGLWDRDELDLKTRSLCTVAILVALERSPASLEDQMRGALANGATKDEIAEVIVQAAFYAGLPVFSNGARAAMAVFAQAEM